MKRLYTLLGVDNKKIVFLFTASQVPNILLHLQVYFGKTLKLFLYMIIASASNVDIRLHEAKAIQILKYEYFDVMLKTYFAIDFP